MPKLVGISGYPGTGKTRVSFYLAGRGFARVSVDDMRQMLFGKNWPELTEDENNLAWLETYNAKLDLLYRGRDVVFDSTAHNNETRKYWVMGTEGLPYKIPVEKYLVVLRTHRSLLEGREKRKRDLAFWDENWEDPSEEIRSLYTVLEYQNNIPWDYRSILRDLRRRLSLK